MTYDEYTKKVLASVVSARRAVFDEYCAYVYTVVRSRLISCARNEDVEECVSDVFAEIYIYLDKHPDHSGELTGIVSVIARRKAIDYYYRSNGKAFGTEELSETQTDGTNIESDYEQKEQRRRLLAAIEELGQPDSTIIIQKYFFGYKSGEIAKSVGLNSAAVRMRCSRALKKLRKMLTDSETGGSGYEKKQEYI